MKRIASLVAAAALTAATSGCGLFGGDDEKKYAAADPAPVALTSSLKGPVKIGLVTSADASPQEGGDVAALAQGARVAQSRFAAGGTKVELDVRNDQGTAAGATKAVQDLVSDGVLGIVYASQGPHLAAGIDAAKAAGVPVLLPYAEKAPTQANAWLTGPSEEQVVSVLLRYLSAQGQRPYIVSLGGNTKPVLALSSGLGTASHTVFSPVGITLPAGGVQSVAVWGSAADSAQAVQRLQTLKASIPVVLSSAALSPVFTDALATSQSGTGKATLSGTFVTAGLPTDPLSAQGAAFGTAARLAAADADTYSVLNGRVRFSAADAADADGRAHDAVVLLVRAAEKAKFRTAPAVLAALTSLSAGAQTGIVGPALALSDHAALPNADVSALQATVDSRADRLDWFAVPVTTATP